MNVKTPIPHIKRIGVLFCTYKSLYFFTRRTFLFLRFIRMARIAYAAAKTSKMVAVTINHVEVSTSCPCCKTCTISLRYTLSAATSATVESSAPL